MGGRSQRKIRTRLLSVGLGLALGVLLVLVAGLLIRYQATGFGTAEWGDEIPEKEFWDYEGTKLDGKGAPDFRLVDQRGAAVSLADLRGKVVVLTLLDPDCTDICPLYAHQFRLAHQALREDAAKVAFVAFNANDQKTAVDEMRAATKKWAMEEIPTWHFLTGSPEELQAVWKDYGLYASGAPKADKPDELQHSPAVYIIDQAGQRQWYLSTNFEGARPLSKLIAEHARALLDRGR